MPLEEKPVRAKRTPRVVAWIVFVISLIWSTMLFGPLVYSLLRPNPDIQHVVGALEGRETLSGDLSALPQQVTSSAGRLNRAIQVGAYWHTAADFSAKGSHVTKTSQVSYLAWFERRSEPTIMFVTRTETDGSHLEFKIGEGEVSDIVKTYLWPLLGLVLSLSCLLWIRSRSSKAASLPANTSSLPQQSSGL